MDLLFDNLVVITSILIFSQFRTGLRTVFGFWRKSGVDAKKKKFVCQIGFSIKALINPAGGILTEKRIIN